MFCLFSLWFGLVDLICRLISLRFFVIVVSFGWLMACAFWWVAWLVLCFAGDWFVGYFGLFCWLLLCCLGFGAVCLVWIMRLFGDFGVGYWFDGGCRCLLVSCLVCLICLILFVVLLILFCCLDLRLLCFTWWFSWRVWGELVLCLIWGFVDVLVVLDFDGEFLVVLLLFWCFVVYLFMVLVVLRCLWVGVCFLGLGMDWFVCVGNCVLLFWLCIVWLGFDWIDLWFAGLRIFCGLLVITFCLWVWVGFWIPLWLGVGFMGWLWCDFTLICGVFTRGWWWVISGPWLIVGVGGFVLGFWAGDCWV